MNDRDKKVDEALRLIWSSLESHLPLTDIAKGHSQFKDDRSFHRKCCKDYIRLLQIIKELW